MMALVIPVEGLMSYVEIKGDLESIQAHLDGGWLEMVSLSAGHAYIDEEAKLKGLPFNPRATRIANSLGWQADDVINGPAVFLGDGANGEEGDVPDAVVEASLEVGS